MGTYLSFKTDEPEKVNATFQYESKESMHGVRVVNSRSTILEDIAYIAVDPEQVHLRNIKTVEGWNNTFTRLAEGRGQVKLSGYDLSAEDQAVVDFVVEHQDLFTEIDDQSGEYISKEPEIERGWWTLRCTVPPDDSSRQHIAQLIEQGYTEGEIIQEIAQ